jgi:hypothetical protein
LPAQCEHLQEALAAGEDLEGLLDRCAALADPSPLAWLCARQGLIQDQSPLLAAKMIEWPETSLLRVLRGLPPQPALETLLREALRRIGVDRLAVLAMLERNLKHAFPPSYEEYLCEIEAQLPGDRSLALLPARSLWRLDDRQRQRRAELARQALEQLGRAPKAVSLSHAEELLSRRVYTQPGHFLFELLQNAEDAQARTFRVRFEQDRVVVWHDGLPFDVRDLVGVTSIGQTTKKKQQIGFFGVGFKSVYEVTDRPQIYSDVFCFEIIDVSIPRALERPPEVDEAGTTLILPLKQPFPELPQIARQLDAGVLLTLTHLREIDLGDNWVLRRQGNRVGEQQFLIDESEHTYAGPERDRGRPDTTQILVAIWLDEQGRAVPVPPATPTIYSYLPTSQPSGLRFMIHSHFDVPVDRERIHPESAWNRWILEQVPAALARLAAAHDLLDVLPLPGEASGPFAFLPEALRSSLQTVSCLPGQRCPGEVRLTSPEIAALPLALPLWAPEGRLRQVAEQVLGCPSFGISQLIETLEANPIQPDYPAVYAVLGPDLETHYHRLRQLAIVPSAGGTLGTPASLAMASPDLRALYPPERLVAAELEGSVYLLRLHCRSLEAEDLVADLESGMAATHPELALRVLARASSAVKERAARLPLFLARDGRRYSLARMGEWTGAAHVSQPDLAEFYAGKRPLLAEPYPDWPTLELDYSCLAVDLLEGRLPQIPHDLLEQGFRHIPEVLLQRLADLPLWPDQPLTGALRATYPELLTLFPETRFVPPELASRAHVQALTPHPAGVDMVLERFARIVDREAALEFLYQHAEKVSSAAAARLLGQVELPDDRGRAVPVPQLQRPETAALRELYHGGLDRPFVGPAAGRLLERMGLLEKLAQVGLRELLDDLACTKPEPDHARQLVAYLASRAGELSRAEAQRCLALPLFPDRPLGGRELLPGLTTVWLVEESLQPLLRESGWLLLDPSLRADAEELMAAALRQPAGIREVLDLYSRLGALGNWLPGASLRLLEAPALLRLLACLQHHPEALVGYTEFDQLPIWPTGSGGRLAAGEVVDLTPLRSVLDCEPLQLLEAAWECYQKLRLKPLDGLDYLRQRVKQEAREGLALSEQPEFLCSPERVQRVAELLDGPPLLDGNGCLRLQSLLGCDSLTASLLPPALLGEVSLQPTPALKPLPSLRVVQSVVQLEPRLWRADGALRQRFYQWLLERENEVFSCPESRRLLREQPLWLSGQERLLAAKDLVLQDGIPDLGVDWLPHREIPSELTQVLQRHLGVGKPRPQELLQSHLLPAYRKATENSDHGYADALLAYLVENLSDRPGLLGPDFPLRDRRGRYRPAHQVVWPDPELGLESLFQDYLLSHDYSADQVRFLRGLGLAELPPWEVFDEVFERPKRAALAQSLARLLAAWVRRKGEEILHRVPGFRTQNWLPDALGAPRRPQQLFLPGGELEALIGTHGRLYPDPLLADTLGEDLMLRLGLRDRSQVGLDEVLAHLRLCSQNSQAVSFRVYQWLESNFSRWPDLPARLAPLNWIQSDDGLWFSHRRTLGVHAFTLFGNRRGYWERGQAACPKLCELFEIPSQVTPEGVRLFVEEIGAEVTRHGDRDILRRDRALSRMLLACYTQLAHLGPAPLDRGLPVVLAQARPGKEKRLLPANHPALLCSDTPSLEKLFEGAGTFFVAEPGTLDQRPAVEAFHAAMGIRSLRDAFTISLEAGGVERTGECGPGIARLRTCLRSLLAVLPRIRRQRDQLLCHGWLDQQRLKPLAHTGPIRVIENLKVSYQLAGVGVAQVQVAGTYNRARGELLVDLSLAVGPDAPLTGLAQGLVPCLYQGPGEEQLVDILEILLPLDSRERMDAYLDARHFPTAQATDGRPEDRLGERLGEALDYQVDQRLKQRFPELGDLSLWREADLLAGCQDATQAVQRLLLQAGVEAPSAELRQALRELFTVSSLDQLQLQPTPASPEVYDHGGAPASPETPLVYDHGGAPASPETPLVYDHRGAPASPETPAGEGLLTKVRNWLWGYPAVQEVVTQLLPSWVGGGNPYEPTPAIQSQFWGTRDKMEELSNRPPRSGLFHQPIQLPKPYLYAAQLLAGSFDASNQRWLPVSANDLKHFWAGQPTGRLIPFEGTLRAGLNRLPLPLYTRLHGELQLSCKGRVQQGPLGEVTVQFQASQPASARFQVEIMEPPRLSQESVRVPESWLRPTTLDLPAEVVSWISRTRSLLPWERALAAQEFVNTRYAYDPDYLSHPESKQVLRSLRRGQGNHHLQLLHARRQGDWLGFGMCIELNTMLCELLRHLEVPALLANGWVLDEGFLENPDHLFAVAVLASLQGPCLMPLDASVSQEGPLRSLGRRRPPTSSLARVPALPAPPGAWSASPTLRRVGEGEDLRKLEQQLCQLELKRHLQAVQMVLQWRGVKPGDQLQVALRGDCPQPQRLALLQQTLHEQLPSPEVGAALVRLLSGDYQSLVSLPPAVEELVRLGLAQVQRVPVMQVKALYPSGTE